jgi:hypothetical protein
MKSVFNKKIKNIPHYWVDWTHGVDRHVVMIRGTIKGTMGLYEVVAEIPYRTTTELEKTIDRAYSLMKDIEEGRVKVKDLKHNYNKST